MRASVRASTNEGSVRVSVRASTNEGSVHASVRASTNEGSVRASVRTGERASARFLVRKGRYTQSGERNVRRESGSGSERSETEEVENDVS